MNPFPVALLILTAAAWPLTSRAAELPKGLTEVCKSAPKTFEKSRGLAEKAPSARTCAEQTKKSWDACHVDSQNQNENKDLLDVTNGNGGGASGADQKLAAAYKAGRDREVSKSRGCGEERQKMADACAEVRKEQVADLRAKTVAMDSVEQALQNGDDPNRASYLQQKSQLQKESRELQEEMVATRSLLETSTQAVTDQGSCYTNQARIYDDALNETQTHLQGVSAGDVGEVATNAATKAVGDKSVLTTLANPAKDAVQGVVQDKAVEAVKTEASVWKGAATKVASTVPTVEAGAFKTAAGFVGARALPVVGAFLGMTNDAGSCSELNANPVSAYNSGCSRNTAGALNVLNHN